MEDRQSPLGPTPLLNVPPELADHPDYEVLRELGRGGMGIVYLAKHRLSGRLEVLKVMSKALIGQAESRERFLREIQAAARLDHRNVVKMYTALERGELMVLVMEYVPGEDLAEVVKARGPLSLLNACYYVHQAASGLQHAFEKGMVHRDIKPQNLMLLRDGKKHTIKILDFGLAKATRGDDANTGLTSQGAMMGTPGYVAPEQILDAAAADIRADIYSLGCTLYHLLSGTPPFSGTSLFEILQAHQTVEARPLNLARPEAPVALAAVVRKMMAKKASQRYATPAEVVRALDPFVKGGLNPLPPRPAPAKQGPRDAARAALLAQETIIVGQETRISAAKPATAERGTQRFPLLIRLAAVPGMLMLGLWLLGMLLVFMVLIIGEGFSQVSWEGVLAGVLAGVPELITFLALTWIVFVKPHPRRIIRLVAVGGQLGLGGLLPGCVIYGLIKSNKTHQTPLDWIIACVLAGPGSLMVLSALFLIYAWWIAEKPGTSDQSQRMKRASYNDLAE